MNDQMRAVIEELPDKPSRSRLEPYKEFIEELRRRGRTYKDIASIFAEKFSIRVTAAGVHDFVRRRRPADLKAKPKDPKGIASQIDLPVEAAPIVAGKTGPAPDPQAFQFDPDEPLRLTAPRKK
jgi:hypothetical protein